MGGGGQRKVSDLGQRVTGTGRGDKLGKGGKKVLKAKWVAHDRDHDLQGCMAVFH